MEEEKKEGFSYTSPEKQRKSAAKLFIFEVVLLAIVIVGIVSALFYLGILKLPNMPKNPTSYIGQKGRLPDPKNTRNTETKDVESSVSLISDTPKLSIKETSPDELLEFIKGYDVFGRKYLLSPGQFSDFLQKIEIHLTDVVQPNNKFLLIKQIPVSSSGFTFTDNTLKLTIQLSDEAFGNEKVAPEVYFMQSLLFDVYNMSKDPSGIGLTQVQKDELKKLTDEMYGESKNYVTITRK